MSREIRWGGGADVDMASLIWLGLKNNIHSRPTRRTLHNMYRVAEYFSNYSIVGTVNSRVAQFSVSNISPEAFGDRKKDADKFLRDIKIREKMALTFYRALTYGIGAMVPMVKKKKYIMCPACGTKYYLKDLVKHGKPVYRWESGRIKYECRNKRCKQHKRSQRFDLMEHQYPSKNRFILEPWDPYYLTPNKNEITGETQWIYTIPPTTAKKIKDGDHHTILTTPNLYINAALNNNKITIYQDNIFIIEMLTGKIDGMPIPPLIRAFHELDLNEAYKNANKKIADDLLIPLRMMFPITRGPSGMPPQMMQSHNAYDLNSVVAGEIEKWRQNRDYIPVSPVEIGSKDYWGHGKMFALHNEIRQNINDILAILGFPMEILYGGVTWSRQNTSAMMLSQAMESLTIQGQSIVDNLAVRYNDMIEDKNDVSFKITPPRLVDYLGELSFIREAVAEGRISNSSYVDKLGHDANIENKIISEEEAEFLERAERAGKSIGAQEAARAQRMLQAQKELRELERSESIKDTLAQMPIMENQMNMNMEMQEKVLKQNLKGQEYLGKLQMALQEQGLSSQMEANKEMMLAQEDAQDRMMKKQMDAQLKMMAEQLQLQAESVPLQMMAQYEGEKAVAERQEQEQMAQYIQMGEQSLSEEEIQQLSQMGEEEAQQFLLQRGQDVEMQQYFESLPEEQKAEIGQLPEQEQAQAIQSLMQEEQESQMRADDPVYQKQQEKMMDEQVEAQKEQEQIQQLAERYKHLRGIEKGQFIAELMNEDATLYSKVKNYAEMDLLTGGVRQLMNTTEQDERNEILKYYKNNFPELYDQLVVHWQKEITKNYEADRFAKALYTTKDEQKKQELVKMLNENSPEEFRALVMNYYRNIMEQEYENNRLQKVTSKIDERRERYREAQAKQMALEVKSYPEEQRLGLIKQMRAENPDVAKRMMKYLEGENYGQDYL